jgi:predicted pyridoxine 5'-phosphate oxidase superfamily flavin-nucleotide-binding protein
LEQEHFMVANELPGSHGEHLFQLQHGSVSRARAFYRKQMLDHLNASMREFLGEQEMVFLATADGKGECDCSFRAGEKGFIHVLDERTLVYPEYRGNGVYASLGNLAENPHVALLFLDFFHHGIGLHVNGRARVCEPEELTRAYRVPLDSAGTGRRPELWVLVEVVEAYIHCSKHIPLLVKRPKEIDWGTDDVQKKGGDFFHAKDCLRPWHDAETNGRPQACPP